MRSTFIPLRAQPFLAALLLGLGAASTGLAPAADGDIWWHLAAGRQMVEKGRLLFADPFSVSASGRTWVDVHWLFQLAVYAVHQALGLTGLVLVKCALIGIGSVLLFFAIESKRSSWARGLLVSVLVAGLLVARTLLLVRPVIGTLVFLALFFFELERFRRDGRVRRLWVLPLAQMVWANFQGLSALGPALVAAYAVAAVAGASFGAWPAWPFAREGSGVLLPWRRARLLLAALGGCILATFVSPFGWRGATLPALLLGRLLPGEHNVFSHQVVENLPPFVLERMSGEFWHFKWFLMLFALAALFGGRRLLLSHALVLLGFAGLALISNRNALLLYWIGAPIAAINLAPRLRHFLARQRRRASLRLAVGVNVALVGVLFGVSAAAASQESTLAEPSPFRVPAESARRLAAMPSGDVFSADHQGGYLIWQLYPRFRPYDEFAEYLRVVDDPERFATFQARHHFSYVVLPVRFPERYQRLIATLYASPDWKLLFTDGSEVLFARRELAIELPAVQLDEATTTDGILEQLRQRLGRVPKAYVAARLSLATLDGAVGQFVEAERALTGIDAPEAKALAARLRFAAGDLESAERLARQRLARARDDVPSLNLMALIAFARGEPKQGLRLLRRALRIQPFDREAAELLADLEEK